LHCFAQSIILTYKNETLDSENIAKNCGNQTGFVTRRLYKLPVKNVFHVFWALQRLLFDSQVKMLTLFSTEKFL